MSTGLILPRAVGGTAVGWDLADYLTLSLESQPADGNATCVLEIPAMEDDERWLIDHAVVSTTSTTVTDLRWYDGAAAPRYMIEQTDNGNLDVGDWSGLQRTPGAVLTLVWNNVSPGARASANLQIRVLRRRS